MPVGATLAAAAIGAGGSMYAANKAEKAGHLQADAAREGYAQQLAMQERSRADLEPYTQTGKGAVLSLAQLYGLPTPGNPGGGQAYGPEALQSFRNAPDYRFALQEGLRETNFANARLGLAQSGNNLRDISKYTTGLAGMNFNNYANRLMNLSNMGLGAARAGIGADQGYANQLSSLTGQAGEAGAAGMVGGANAINAGAQNIGNMLALYGARKGMQSPGAYDPAWGATELARAPQVSNWTYATPEYAQLPG